ncbi:unnamed protein product [Closterium sp. Naga37s-1]|nr:unnamed protein product [Closterium sp. Naga37s-1]
MDWYAQPQDGGARFGASRSMPPRQYVATTTPAEAVPELLNRSPRSSTLPNHPPYHYPNHPLNQRYRQLPEPGNDARPYSDQHIPLSGDAPGKRERANRALRKGISASSAELDPPSSVRHRNDDSRQCDNIGGEQNELTEYLFGEGGLGEGAWGSGGDEYARGTGGGIGGVAGGGAGGSGRFDDAIRVDPGRGVSNARHGMPKSPSARRAGDINQPAVNRRQGWRRGSDGLSGWAENPEDVPEPMPMVRRHTTGMGGMAVSHGERGKGGEGTGEAGQWRSGNQGERAERAHGMPLQRRSKTGPDSLRNHTLVTAGNTAGNTAAGASWGGAAGHGESFGGFGGGFRSAGGAPESSSGGSVQSGTSEGQTAGEARWGAEQQRVAGGSGRLAGGGGSGRLVGAGGGNGGGREGAGGVAGMGGPRGVRAGSIGIMSPRLLRFLVDEDSPVGPNPSGGFDDGRRRGGDGRKAKGRGKDAGMGKAEAGGPGGRGSREREREGGGQVGRRQDNSRYQETGGGVTARAAAAAAAMGGSSGEGGRRSPRADAALYFPKSRSVAVPKSPLSAAPRVVPPPLTPQPALPPVSPARQRFPSSYPPSNSFSLRPSSGDSAGSASGETGKTGGAGGAEVGGGVAGGAGPFPAYPTSSSFSFDEKFRRPAALDLGQLSPTNQLEPEDLVEEDGQEVMVRLGDEEEEEEEEEGEVLAREKYLLQGREQVGKVEGAGGQGWEEEIYYLDEPDDGMEYQKQQKQQQQQQQAPPRTKPKPRALVTGSADLSGDNGSTTLLDSLEPLAGDPDEEEDGEGDDKGKARGWQGGDGEAEGKQEEEEKRGGGKGEGKGGKGVGRNAVTPRAGGGVGGGGGGVGGSDHSTSAGGSKTPKEASQHRSKRAGSGTWGGGLVAAVEGFSRSLTAPKGSFGSAAAAAGNASASSASNAVAAAAAAAAAGTGGSSGNSTAPAGAAAAGGATAGAGAGASAAGGGGEGGGMKKVKGLTTEKKSSSRTTSPKTLSPRTPRGDGQQQQQQQPGTGSTEGIFERGFTDIRKRFEVGQQIGQGRRGVVVYMCVERRTGRAYACKAIDKATLVEPRKVAAVRAEVDVMRKLLGWPHVVGIKDALEDEKCVYIFMELCSGGDLLDHINSSPFISEREAAIILRVLAETLRSCHNHGIMHRDLKPENILLAQPGCWWDLRLADFGFSVHLKAGERMTGYAGSPFYMAPEVLDSIYGHEADVWSLGVILYTMLSQKLPFWDDTDAGVYRQIKRAQVDMESGVWPAISDEGKDLVLGMLSADPHQRITLDRLLGFWDDADAGVYRQIKRDKVDMESGVWPAISDEGKDISVMVSGTAGLPNRSLRFAHPFLEAQKTTRRFPAPIPPRTCAQEASACPYSASPHSGSPYGAISSASPVPLRRYNSVTSPAPPPVSLPPAGSSPAPKSPLFRTPSLGAPVRISAAREQPSPPMFLPPTASETLPIAVPLYIPPNHPPAGPADRSFAPSCAYEPRAQQLDRAFVLDGGCAYEQRVPPRGPPGPLARGNSGAASRRAAPIPRHSSLPLAASAYPSGNYSSAVTNSPCPVLNNHQRHAKGPAGNLVTSRDSGGKYDQAGGWEKPFIHRSTSAPVPDDEAWEEEREYEEGEEEEEGEDWEEEMGENEMAAEGEGRRGEMSGAGGWGVSARTGGAAGGETRGWRGEEPRRQLDRSYLTSAYDQQQQQQQQQSHLARHLSLEPHLTDNRSGQTRGDGERAEGREGRGANLLRQASDGQCLARNGGYGRGARRDAQDGQYRGDRQQPDRQQPDRQQPEQPDRRQLDRRHVDGMYVDRSEPDRERLIELRLRRVERRRQQQWHHERQRKAAHRLMAERRQQWELWRQQQQQGLGQEEQGQKQGQQGQGQGQEQQQEWFQKQQQQQVYEQQQPERDEYEREQPATSPYQQATSPYQQATSPYQQATSPYQQATSPYQQATSPYQQATSPYQSLTHRTRLLPQHYQPCTDQANPTCTSSALPSNPTCTSSALPSNPTCTSHLQRSASDGRAMTGQVAPDKDSPDQVVPAQVLGPNPMAPGQVVPQLVPSRSLRQLRRVPPLDSKAQKQQPDPHRQRADTQEQRACVAAPEPTQSSSHQTLSQSPPPCSSPYLPPRSPPQSPPISPPYASPCSPPLSPPASTGTAICHSPSFVWPRGNGPDFGTGGRAALGGADKWVACFVPQCWNRN